MGQVFVSYSEKDSAAVEPITRALNQASLSVETSVDSRKAEDLQRMLDDAQCVILIWSAAAAEFPRWQPEKLEMRSLIRAWSSSRLLVAVLDDTLLPVGLGDIAPIVINGKSGSGTVELIQQTQVIVATAKSREGSTNESSSDRPDDWPNAPVATEQRPRKNITGVRAFLAFIVSLCALFLASYWWLLPSDSPEPPRPRIKGIFHEDYSDSFAANLFWGGKEWLLHVFSVPWGKEWLLLFFSVLAGVLLGLSISWAWIAERRRKGHSRIVRVVGEPTPSGG